MIIKEISKQLRAIPEGESRTYKCRDGAHIHSVQTMAYRLKHIDNVNYRTKADREKLLITITNAGKTN